MIKELLITTLVMSSTSYARSMKSFLFMFININEVLSASFYQLKIIINNFFLIFNLNWRRKQHFFILVNSETFFAREL